MTKPLLKVRDLRVTYWTDGQPSAAVREVSFDVGREKVGLVGESGSGKSSVARAIMRLLPGNAGMRASEVNLLGRDLVTAGDWRMRRLRGRTMAMVFQEARLALNPVMTVGRQLMEACQLHLRLSERKAYRRGLELLADMDIAEPERVWRLYSHQLSGGMGQRVLIALMLAGDPALLIADEVTSSLDVLARQKVLEVLDRQVAERGMGLLIVSHDLTMVSTFCDRVLVMENGELVEQLAAADVERAQHPYTQKLLAARTRLEREMAPGRAEAAA